MAFQEDVGVRMIRLRFDVMSFHLLESQQVVNLSPDSKAGEVKKWLISKGFSERFAGFPQCIYFPTEKKITLTDNFAYICIFGTSDI